MLYTSPAVDLITGILLPFVLLSLGKAQQLCNVGRNTTTRDEKEDTTQVRKLRFEVGVLSALKAICQRRQRPGNKLNTTVARKEATRLLGGLAFKKSV